MNGSKNPSTVPSAGLAVFRSAVHQRCVTELQGASTPTTENIRNWASQALVPVVITRLVVHPNLAAPESIVVIGE